MLEFRQIEGSGPPLDIDGPPLDIEVTTDDANAELAAIGDMFEHGEMYGEEFLGIRSFNDATVGDDGLCHFVIPGDEAGEIADVWDELGAFLHECNDSAMSAAMEAEVDG